MTTARVARGLRPGNQQVPDCLAAGAESVIGRFVGYNTGAVQLLTAPFTIGASGLLTSSAPGVVYSSASNEFLVAWTDGPTTSEGSGSMQTAQRSVP